MNKVEMAAYMAQAHAAMDMHTYFLEKLKEDGYVQESPGRWVLRNDKREIIAEVMEG